MNKLLYNLFVFFLICSIVLTCNTTENPPEKDLLNSLNNQPDSPKEAWLIQTDKVALLAENTFADPLESTYQNLTIFVDDQVMYQNKETIFTTFYGLLPIVQTLKNGTVEVLIGLTDASTHNQILRLQIADNQVIKEDTLPMFTGENRDIDGDGKVEFAGFLEQMELYCVGCDSTYYNPLLIYERNDEIGMTLDRRATSDWIQEHYGIFHGFLPDANIVVPLLQDESFINGKFKNIKMN